MFRSWWLSLLILGIAVSVVLTHDDLPPGHSEDEHDEEPEDQADEQHPDEDETADEEKDDSNEEEEDEDQEEEDESQGDESDDDTDQSHLEHDAFLGDNYTEFKGLSPEDAKTKLAQLIKDEVDLNKDGLLTEDEIRQRFHVTTKEYRKKEVMETMKQHDEDKDGKVSWEEFKKGHFSDDGKDDDIKEQMKEDEEKFKFADEDGDGKLDLEEYLAFYHPGDNPRMAEFTIEDSLKKHDKDKDGQISKKEFLATFSDVNDDAKEEMEKDFTTNFDKDKSGKLGKEEMKSWLFPDDDFSIEEPKTLIKEADENHDGKLTMDEIMKNYKVFIEDEQDDSNHDEL
ncbi:calumenin-like [Orbicella faveolata]|uniref:calumenin-like n=1 Tax=Orbicella faveolata TaxID=48498 RepID=UPI0009E4FCAE|nr:calumenin-like [Orbicella faveolata]